MNSIKNIKILLPIVILAWGYVAYQLYQYYKSEPPTLIQNTAVNYSPPVSQKKEAYDLLPVTSDPFLGNVYRQKNHQNTTSVKNTKAVSKTPWPSINYHGLVSDAGAEKKVFVLTIDGKQYLVSKGDVIEDIKVLTGDKNNILLRLNNTKKEFLKM